MKKVIDILKGKRVPGNGGLGQLPVTEGLRPEKKTNGRAQTSEFLNFRSPEVFQDSFIVAGKSLKLVVLAVALSVFVHLTAGALLVGVPLMNPGDMPPVEVYSAFLAPRPSPSPPPAPPGGSEKPGKGKIAAVKSQPLVEPGKLVAPIDIPPEITDEEITGGGDRYGVPGGVEYSPDEKTVWDRTIEEFMPLAFYKEEEPVRAIGEIKLPRLLRRVEPDYPQVAREARVEGVVILEATTDIYGRVQSVKVLRSVPLLDQAAIEAVRQWVYEPMVINGRPRGVVFTVTITFRLKK
jgi:protein TonB